MAQVNNYGAAPTYVKIASYTAPSAVASYTFSNIPQGYTDLILTINTGSNVSGENISLRFNSDSGSNYSVTEMYSGGSQRESNQARLRLQMGPGLNTTIYDNFIANIMSYSNTTTYKTLVSRHNVATGTYPGVGIMVGMWRNTAPITSIYLFLAGSSNFLSGSTFTIYGIKAALVPKATGGDIIVQDGSYWYHAFRTTGSFQPKQALTCDYLVVAGGGGGSYNLSSGAGAGGYRSATSQSFSGSTAYTITVGAGGTAGAGDGTNGSASSISGSGFTTFSASGGGRGNAGGSNGISGGSGGGAPTGAVYTGGAGNAGGYTPVEGYAGGATTSYSGVPRATAGGGGAGAVGQNSAAGGAGIGGIGGAGSNAHASWLYATSLGVSGYLAGGGGGTGESASSAGGAGGGGASGAASGTGVAGGANTGGGGGGGGNGNGIGGAGGSGLVIVRYSI